MTKKLKILEVCNLDRFAASPYMLPVFRWLAEQGHDVHVACRVTVFADRLREAGLEVHDLPITRNITPLQDLKAYRRLKSLIREGGFDIVHTHNPKDGVLGRTAAWKLEVPAVIHTCNGFYFSHRSSGLKRWLVIKAERFAGKRCHLVIFVNTDDLALAAARKIVGPLMAKLIYNGVDLERFHPGKDEALRDELGIPAGATVTTASAVRFVTLNEVRLPAGMGRFVETPVEAAQAGEQGNVAENAINLVEGSLGLSVLVSNPQPLSGGSSVMEIGATEEDRARLRGTIVETLLRKAEAELRSARKDGDLLFPDTVEPVEIIEEVFSPSPGEPGSVLTLKMKVRFTARYVSAEDLLQLSLLALNASLEDGFEAAGPPAYKATAAPSTGADGTSRFEIEASRPLLRRVDKMAVFALARGLTPRQARSALASSFSLRYSPEIEITPSWYPWLPLIPLNLSVTLQ
jgi:hypothetical protein